MLSLSADYILGVSCSQVSYKKKKFSLNESSRTGTCIMLVVKFYKCRSEDKRGKLPFFPLYIETRMTVEGNLIALLQMRLANHTGKDSKTPL